MSVRRQMAALLTENHLYEKAYQMVQIDGYDYLKTSGASPSAAMRSRITAMRRMIFCWDLRRAPSGRENTAMSC